MQDFLCQSTMHKSEIVAVVSLDTEHTKYKQLSKSWHSINTVYSSQMGASQHTAVIKYFSAGKFESQMNFKSHSRKVYC